MVVPFVRIRGNCVLVRDTVTPVPQVGVVDLARPVGVVDLARLVGWFVWWCF